MNKNLLNIYGTIFLSIFAGSFIIPIFPFLVRDMGYPDFYTGLGFSLYYIGMFFGGIGFGYLSDVFGRKRTLMITLIPDLIGYIILFFSGNISFLLLSRVFMGVGGSTFPVGQGFISVISKSEDKVKNMAFTGALFGVAFVLGPSLGGIIYEKFGMYVVLVPIVLLIINLITVSFIKEPKEDDLHYHLDLTPGKGTKQSLIVLFSIAFLLSLAFSNIQVTFPLLLSDRFGLSEGKIGYLFAYIGICSIIYQGFLMKYVRKYVSENQMILIGSGLLSLGFLVFGINTIFIMLFAIIPLFALGNGTLMPGMNSLISKIAKKKSGSALGFSSSMQSVASIVGGILSASLYHISPTFPYFVSSAVLIALFMLSLSFFGAKKELKGL